MFNSLPLGESCPLNESGWNKRKSNFSCTGGDEYHCIPNNKQVPGEICLLPSWVQPNYCPVYNLNAGEVDLVPCDLQRGMCSDKDFQSHEVYKYPGCLNLTRKDAYKTQYTYTTDGRESAPSGSGGLPILPLIVGGVSFVCIVVVIGCVCWLCRRTGNGSGRKKTDVEMHQPLIETFPEEFHRTCHYLKANVFYPTKVYTKCVGLFEVHGSLLLIGPHGSGKTSIAVNLLSKKVGTTLDGKNCYVAVCQSVEEVAGKIDDYSVTYVLLDDALDQYAYLPSLIESHRETFERLKKCIEDGQLRLICTVNDAAWKTFSNKMSACPLFGKELQIELSEKSVDKNEKLEILKKHLNYQRFMITQKKKDENLKRVDKRNDKSASIAISVDTLKSWAKKAKVKNGVGVPLLFDLLSTNRHLFASVDNVLSDSLESTLKMRLSHLRKDSTGPKDKDYAVLLTFAAFNGGKVTLEDFKTKELTYVELCSKMGCGAKSKEEIDGLINTHEMQGFLYPLRGGLYVFHHTILTALILSDTANDFEELVLGHAKLDVLFRMLQSRKTRPQIPLKIFLNEKSLPTLVQRISQENPDVIAKWQNHVVMQSEKLQGELKEALQANKDGGAKKK